jgi:hypothetical protein
MPTSYVRLIMAGLTVVLAVFTGLVTGFVAGGPGCDQIATTPTSVVSGPPSTGKQAPATHAGQPSAESDRTATPGFGIGNALTADKAANCSGFEPLTAVFGFFGALFTGGIVGGAALFLPRVENEPEPQPATAYQAVGAATGSHPVLTDPIGPPGSPSTAPGTSIAPPPPAPETRRLVAERRTLVETCIYVRDRASSKAISDRLAWALGEVGVVEDRPTGERFDTARHEAGGTAPTDDQRREGTIAAVEITGYTDRGNVVRAPVVTVFRTDNR